jgi:fructose 1,6-bisphosphatase
MDTTHEMADLLIDLGIAGVGLVSRPTSKTRNLNRADTLPDSIVAHLQKLARRYVPDDDPAVQQTMERSLRAAGELGLPTHTGSAAWFLAVGGAMKAGQ